MRTDCDFAIVGTGPAGMFAALEVVDRRPGARIVMLEKGPVRPMGDKSNVTSGWGGAGAFSDGKLDLSHVVGGTVHEEIGLEAFNVLMPSIDRRYCWFGGDPTRLVDARRDPETWRRVESLMAKALGSGLDLRPFPIRHLGTDTAFEIVMNIRRYLEARGVVIMTGNEAESLARDGDGWIVSTVPRDPLRDPMRKIHARYVLASPGRSGAEWMAAQARSLGLKLFNNGVDIGVRVEVRDETLRDITQLLYESKLIYQSKTYGDRLRTFCMCPSGYVAMEDYRGLKTVNGHSYRKAGRVSPNTNFAILVTQVFTEPFNEPLTYGKYISGLANLLSGGGVLVQRLGDLRRGRRSKQEKVGEWFVQPTLGAPEAIPGDLSLVIPPRFMTGIVEMLEAMEEIAPGIASDHTLLYGVEVKFYSFKVETTAGFETRLPGLYAAGDGSGYTRGLLQSSMQGAIVGRHVAERLEAREGPVVTGAQHVWEELLDERLAKYEAEGAPAPPVPK